MVFILVGDNQREVEGPLRPSQVIGRLVAFVRDGKEISVRQPFYRFLSSLWLFLLPVRPLCFHLSAFFTHHSAFMKCPFYNAFL